MYWLVEEKSSCKRRAHREGTHSVLCVKAALELHYREVVDGDVPEPQLAFVVEEGPRKGVGVERM